MAWLLLLEIKECWCCDHYPIISVLHILYRLNFSCCRMHYKFFIDSVVICIAFLTGVLYLMHEPRRHNYGDSVMSMHHSKHYPGTVFAVIMVLEKINSNFGALYKAEKKLPSALSGAKYYWILYRPF